MDTLDLINDVLFWSLIALLINEAYTIIAHGGIPNRSTAPILRTAIADVIKKYAANTAPTILDLGSGNGVLSSHLARTLPQANVIGIELSKLSFLISNFMKKKAGLYNLSYVHGDMTKYNFSKADFIVMYLYPTLMEKLTKKIEAEAKTGCIIISNKFELCAPWQPIERLSLSSLYLHQKDLFVYRKS